AWMTSCFANRPQRETLSQPFVSSFTFETSDGSRSASTANLSNRIVHKSYVAGRSAGVRNATALRGSVPGSADSNRQEPGQLVVDAGQQQNERAHLRLARTATVALDL